MPLNIPAGMGQANIRLLATNDPQPMYTTLGVRPLVPPLDMGAAQHVYEAFIQSMMANVAAEVQCSGVILRVRQDDGTDQVFEFVPVSNKVGTAPGNAAPNNTAYIFEKLTQRGGKRGRGRMFVPGIPEGQVDAAGNIVAAYASGVQTNLNTFYANLIGNPVGIPGDAVQPVLFHGNTTTTTRSAPGTNPRTVTITTGAPGPAPDDITGFALDPRVGTQRRRLR